MGSRGQKLLALSRQGKRASYFDEGQPQRKRRTESENEDQKMRSPPRPYESDEELDKLTGSVKSIDLQQNPSCRSHTSVRSVTIALLLLFV